MLRVVWTVNGQRVRNLRNLVELLRDSDDEFVVIEFALRGTETLVFSRRELIASTDEILADNDLRSQASPDMLAIWNGGKPHTLARQDSPGN
jgi:hypothetical protein